MKLARFGILAAFALLLASCNGSTGAGPPFAPTFGLTNTSTTDPAGDQFGTLGMPFDILLVQTSRTTIGASTLSVAITFAQPVALPANNAAAGPNENATLLAFNVGAAGSPVALCGAPLFTTYPGVSFVVDPGKTSFYPGSKRQSDGGYLVLNWPALTSTGFEATVSQNTNTLVYTIPLAALGGGSGATQMGVVAGNGSQFRDCAPNSGTIST